MNMHVLAVTSRFVPGSCYRCCCFCIDRSLVLMLFITTDVCLSVCQSVAQCSASHNFAKLTRSLIHIRCWFSTRLRPCGASTINTISNSSASRAALNTNRTRINNNNRADNCSETVLCHWWRLLNLSWVSELWQTRRRRQRGTLCDSSSLWVCELQDKCDCCERIWLKLRASVSHVWHGGKVMTFWAACPRHGRVESQRII